MTTMQNESPPPHICTLPVDDVQEGEVMKCFDCNQWWLLQWMPIPEPKSTEEVKRNE